MELYRRTTPRFARAHRKRFRAEAVPVSVVDECQRPSKQNPKSSAVLRRYCVASAAGSRRRESTELLPTAPKHNGYLMVPRHLLAGARAVVEYAVAIQATAPAPQAVYATTLRS